MAGWQATDDDVWQFPAQFNFTRDVVEALAVADPRRQALTFVNAEGIIDRHTFGEIAAGANRWAALLRTRGLVPGDRLLVFTGETPDWLTILLGALKAGLVVVPCPEMLRARQLAFRGEHAEAQLVVTDRKRAPVFDEIDVPVDVVVVEDVAAELSNLSAIQPTQETASGDSAFILYTSGTSGDPKGVVHTHEYTWANRLQARHWLSVGYDDLVWCTAVTGSAKSIWNVLLGPWSCGAEIVLHEDDIDPERRLGLVQKLGVTVLCQTPTEYRLMAKLPSLAQFDLRRLRHAVSTGEPLDPDVIESFRDAFDLTIHDGYGQTENTVLVGNLRNMEIKPGSMGLPMPGHNVCVIDEEGNEQPVGIEGDIALHGRPPSLFRGYLDELEATSGAFRGPWYVTGDRATRDEDGYLWFTGRADDVIISAATRIGPLEVERVLDEHRAVAESAAVGKPDADRGEIVKAFVVLESEFEPSDELARELQDFARALAAPYVCPSEIEFVPELPKTASGKLRRVELRERERSLARAEEQRRADEARRILAEQRAEEERRVAAARARREADDAAAQARREAEEQRRADEARIAEAERRAADAVALQEAAEEKAQATMRRGAERQAERDERASEERSAANAPAGGRGKKKAH